MNFKEFLWANKEDILVEQLLNMRDSKILPDFIHEKLIEYYKLFLFLGGMPEVLDEYMKTNDVAQCREIQKEILNAYKRDFSKYSDKNQTIKTAQVWNSLPSQLLRENKRFKYSDVRKNARSSSYEQTIQWLNEAGLINIAYNLKVPKLPLKAYTDYSLFKVYLADIGLLGAMLNLTSDLITKPQ